MTLAGVFGMFAGVLASAIESVGDFYACARLSGNLAEPIPRTFMLKNVISIYVFTVYSVVMWKKRRDL